MVGPTLNRLGRALPVAWQEAVMRRARGLDVTALLADLFLEYPPDPRGFDPVGTKRAFSCSSERPWFCCLTFVSVRSSTENTTRIGSSWSMRASAPVVGPTTLPLVTLARPIRPSIGAVIRV